MIKRADLCPKQLIVSHIRSQIAVIYTIQWIQFNTVTFKMASKEGGINTIIRFSTFSLYIIQKNCKMRSTTISQLIVQKFIYENFVKPVLTGCLN